MLPSLGLRCHCRPQSPRFHFSCRSPALWLRPLLSSFRYLGGRSHDSPAACPACRSLPACSRFENPDLLPGRTSDPREVLREPGVGFQKRSLWPSPQHWRERQQESRFPWKGPKAVDIRPLLLASPGRQPDHLSL